MSVAVDLVVEEPRWQMVGDLETLVSHAVEAAQAIAGIVLRDGAEVCVSCCDDAAIRALNRDWRGFDKATNVLSFPASSPLPLDEKPLLGDIAVAFETARREAEEEGRSLADHLTHLVVHGFLHLVGHDHETTAEAEAMEALEIRILAHLDIADPYAMTEPVEASAR